MCGIAGFAGNYSKEQLIRMSEQIRHRGPDSDGIWYNQQVNIGLAHRRLSIIDLSPSGAQPMWSNSGNAVIVFNGEIYNYRELHQQLLKKGCRFHGKSDTEVLVNLYEYYGEKMLPMLNGIYAFALWDARDRLLLVARDGMGVKPLYFTVTQNGFSFASEMKALMQVPDISREIDREAIHYYLTYMWCPAPLTPLKSVRKLEPGNALQVRNGRIDRQWQFYDIPIGQSTCRLSANEAQQQCSDLLEQAVKRQMVADVEVATFLSGGLDSTSISHFARSNGTGKSVKSFTMNYNARDMLDEGLVDDLPYAKVAAAHLGADLRVIDVNYQLFEKLPFLIYHLDEPQSDPAPLNVYYICKYARENGIKVMLSGAGGDDLFTGYRRHQALQIGTMANFIPGGIMQILRLASKPIPEHPALLRRLKKTLYAASFRGAPLLESYFKWLRDDLQRSLYSNDFLSALPDRSVVLERAESLSEDAALIDRMLYLEMKYFLADHNLNYTDKMSMAAGVEVRVPFLDPDLVSFAFSLPARFKQHGWTGKWILKKAMEPHLPREIIYRPKTGFGIPLRKIIIDNTDLITDTYLSPSAITQRGLFDAGSVKTLVEANRHGSIEAGYSIFALICMESWMRIFIDGNMEGTPCRTT
jgi:asparagine synthase (glutamine-hydrolysing)